MQMIIRDANLKKLPLGKSQTEKKIHSRGVQTVTTRAQDQTCSRHQHSKTLQVKGAAGVASSIAARFEHVWLFGWDRVALGAGGVADLADCWATAEPRRCSGDTRIRTIWAAMGLMQHPLFATHSATPSNRAKSPYSHIRRYHPGPTKPPAIEESAGEK